MKWKFAELPDLDNHDDIGFKDNDIEKFGQDPAKSIVREAIQNSSDALDVENNEKQVVVRINNGKVDKSSLPNFEEIEAHIRCCKDESNDESENQEIKRHIDAFEEDEYTYLEISDYNTTGMDIESFKSLTQAIFKSTGKKGFSQGSKGVGKAAYYAASYLRTMLVVTKSDKGLRYRGAAKLANHPSPKDTTVNLNYKGFYGDTELKQIDDIPPLFRRNEKGTSIFVIGLWELEDLQSEIVKEVLRNYWFAIYKEQLLFKLDEIEINKENLSDYIDHHFLDYKDYKTGDKQNPKPYFETILKGKLYERHIPNLGDCQLWLYNNEQFNLGAVARFRKTKMLIYKEKNLDVGFAGVFLCDSEDGNRFLKQIENDAHNEWNVKINPNEKDEANLTLKKIKEFISEEYANYAGITDKDSFYIDELDSLFNFSGDRRNKTGKNKPTPSPWNETNNKKDRLLETTSFEAYTEQGKTYYQLKIKSKLRVKNQKFRISIGTDSSKDIIAPLYTSKGSIIDGKLVLDVNKGDNIIKKIELDTPFIVAPSITSQNN